MSNVLTLVHSNDRLSSIRSQNAQHTLGVDMDHLWSQQQFSRRSVAEMDHLWSQQEYFTGTPARTRRSVQQYNLQLLSLIFKGHLLGAGFLVSGFHTG